jgi:hypothetical protein
MSERQKPKLLRKTIRAAPVHFDQVTFQLKTQRLGELLFQLPQHTLVKLYRPVTLYADHVVVVASRCQYVSSDAATQRGALHQTEAGQQFQRAVNRSTPHAWGTSLHGLDQVGGRQVRPSGGQSLKHRPTGLGDFVPRVPHGLNETAHIITREQKSLQHQGPVVPEGTPGQFTKQTISDRRGPLAGYS